MRTPPALLFIVLTAACGSSTDPPGTTTSAGGSAGTTTSAGEGGGGAACAPVNPAGACAAQVQCVTSAVACDCDQGSFRCGEVQTGDPVSLDLPQTAPADGTCCATEGLICGGFAECGPTCSCVGGVWSCATPTVCPPFTCPDTAAGLSALHDGACPTEVGKVCGIKEGCSLTSCSCNLDPDNGGATWRCSTTPC